MISRGPIFNILQIDLSVAGAKDINAEATIVTFVRAIGAGGNLALDALINVQLGDLLSDAIPMGVNCTAHMRTPTPIVRFTWAAQPGVTAYVLVSADDGLTVQSPPTTQLVSLPTASAVTTASVGVTTAASKIISGDRQSVIIQNLSNADIYIGGAGVTAATGMKIPATGTMVLDNGRGDIWAVTAAGAATDVRILKEV